MNSYYTDTLYPLQDKILAVLDEMDSPFYLTGGTALARCYLNHRYSDDLDFFVNSCPNFRDLVDATVNRLSTLEIKLSTRTESYVACEVAQKLKVEFVHDAGAQFGNSVRNKIYSKVDNKENILANKLTALLGRDEPKDVVDIWALSLKYDFNWEGIFTAANSKAVGVFPPEVAQKLASFPRELLNVIKWTEHSEPQIQVFNQQLEHLISKILRV